MGHYTVWYYNNDSNFGRLLHGTPLCCGGTSVHASHPRVWLPNKQWFCLKLQAENILQSRVSRSATEAVASQICFMSCDYHCPQAIPTKCKDHDPVTEDMPKDVHPSLLPVLEEFKELFSQQLGKTNVTKHTIDTGDARPIEVPPKKIPFHFADKVHAQLEDMAWEGIIRPSNSPWCAPAVYVSKSSGEIRICVDFVQLNKVTKKDSYPVPRSEGPQQKLAGKKIFSKLDLKSAYWQFPMETRSIEKTAFCPGPGYGLWEFTVMPYGLTCATQTCQRGLDTILRDCKYCVDNYVDDCIVFSDNMTSHIQDLRQVLQKLCAAGLTLKGSKCFFGRQDHPLRLWIFLQWCDSILGEDQSYFRVANSKLYQRRTSIFGPCELLLPICSTLLAHLLNLQAKLSYSHGDPDTRNPSGTSIMF